MRQATPRYVARNARVTATLVIAAVDQRTRRRHVSQAAATSDAKNTTCAGHDSLAMCAHSGRHHSVPRMPGMSYSACATLKNVVKMR